MAGPGGRSVGRVSLTVAPDTSELRDQILAVTRHIEASVKIRIPVELDTERLLRHARAAAHEAARLAQVTVRATLDDTQVYTRLRELQRRLRAQDVTIRADLSVAGRLDDAALQGQVRDAITRAQALGPIKLKVVLDDGDFQDSLDDLIRRANRRSLTLQADLDALLAAARLAVLTRPRTVSIIPTIDDGALLRVGTALAALSGGRAAGNAIRGIGSALGNLDQSLPKIASISLAIANLASVALASVSGLVSVGAGLASIAGAGLALPGIFTGFAVGTLALVLALKDAGDQLGSLGPKFVALQDAASAKFWDGARQPILDLTNTLLPDLSAGMGRVSAALGRQIGAFAGALQADLGGGVLTQQFDYLAQSIDIATGAAAPLSQILITLGTIGGAYLPILAQSFTDVATAAAAGVGAAAADGRLNAWIDGGIAAAKDLGNVIAGVGGILAGINDAAQAAGAGGLKSLASGLGAISTAINGPAFQGALTTLFVGAGAAMDGLLTALGPIGAAFAGLAPTLAFVLGVAGDAVGQLVGQIATALNQPAVASGLTDLFLGISNGLALIGPALPAVAAALGAVLSVAGLLAVNLGSVLGAALGALAPILVSVLAAIQPLIPVLGTTLVGIISALAPVIAQIVTTLLPPLVTAIATLLPSILPLVTALLPLATAVLPLIATALSLVTSLLLQVLAAVVPLVITLAGALVPVLTQLISAILPVFGQVLASIIPVFGQVAAAVVPLVSALLDVLIPVIKALLPVVTTVFSAVVSIVSAALKIVAGVINVVTGLISGDWDRVWKGIVQILSGAWDLIKAVVTGAVAIVIAVLKAAWSILTTITTTAWDALKGIISGAWDGIKSAVSSAATAVVGALGAAWAAVKEKTSEAWEALRGIVVAKIVGVIAEVLTIRAKILGAIGDVRSLLVESGKSIIAGLITGILSKIGAVKSAVGSVMEAARNLLPFSPAKEGPFSGKGWTLYSGRSISAALAQGITDNEGLVRAASSSMVDAAHPIMRATAAPGLGAGAAGSTGGASVQITNFNQIERDVDWDRAQRVQSFALAGAAG